MASRSHEATSTALELQEIMQHRSGSPDEEGMPPPRYIADSDPFQLASKLKTEEEIRQIKANTSRKRDNAYGVRAVEKGKQALTTHKLQGFYENQNKTIERMLKPVEEHVRAARELNNENSLKYKIAVYASFAANIILCVVQVYGAVSSGSLSLFTTMADAIFDPMSNLTLLLCNKAVNRVDPRKFPAGKARIETAGNICFCFLMTAVSFIIIAFSIREVVQGSDTLTSSFHLPSIIAISVAFVTKLGLFLYCFALRNQVSQIRILWEDHRNDLIINGLGLATSLMGSKIRWWIDPMGAIILSVLISGLWLHSAYGEFQLLIGVTADTKMQQLITYICLSPPTPWSIDKNLTSSSYDPLPINYRHRHRPRLYLRPSPPRRGRRRHGCLRFPPRYPRRCRGAADEARVSAGCRACLRSRRLRDHTQARALPQEGVVRPCGCSVPLSLYL
jgi:divalent metal cation (Fe/Co/Zn/Cd) transporter